MKDITKTSGIALGSILGLIGIISIGMKGCNITFNNRTIKNSGYVTYSTTKGIYGHIEYTKYLDNSSDVKIYPSFPHRYFYSQLDQDLNGDGKVDRIRRNGPEWKFNKLTELLIRENDYNSNQERFNEADRRLQELIKKYGN